MRKSPTCARWSTSGDGTYASPRCGGRPDRRGGTVGSSETASSVDRVRRGVVGAVGRCGVRVVRATPSGGGVRTGRHRCLPRLTPVARCADPLVSRPGVAAFRSMILSQVGGRDDGLAVCKEIANGSGTLSDHADGRAWDWHMVASRAGRPGRWSTRCSTGCSAPMSVVTATRWRAGSASRTSSGTTCTTGSVATTRDGSRTPAPATRTTPTSISRSRWRAPAQQTSWWTERGPLRWQLRGVPGTSFALGEGDVAPAGRGLEPRRPRHLGRLRPHQSPVHPVAHALRRGVGHDHAAHRAVRRDPVRRRLERHRRRRDRRLRAVGPAVLVLLQHRGRGPAGAGVRRGGRSPAHRRLERRRHRRHRQLHPAAPDLLPAAAGRLGAEHGSSERSTTRRSWATGTATASTTSESSGPSTNTFYFAGEPSAGSGTGGSPAVQSVSYPDTRHLPVIGDWDGGGTDTEGVVTLRGRGSDGPGR